MQDAALTSAAADIDAFAQEECCLLAAEEDARYPVY
jgi:hypothetical protein